MYSIYSVVCLVLPLRSLIPKSLVAGACVNAQGAVVGAVRDWLSLSLPTWGHSKVIIVPTSLTSIFLPDGVALWEGVCFMGRWGILIPWLLLPSCLDGKWVARAEPAPPSLRKGCPKINVQSSGGSFFLKPHL